MRHADSPAKSSLGEIAREWGRIGCIGFGGPPTHVALFRELCVTRRGWLTEAQFERAIAATNLLLGPASTQLAIYCAWRLRGPKGALTGGLSFILPGLALILALSVLSLAGSPPVWVRGAGKGARGRSLGPSRLSATPLAGFPQGLLAALVAFAPSFSFILFGATRFERLLLNERVAALLAGAAPAAAGAIIGSAIPLAGALSEMWQYALLAAAAIALLVLRRSVVLTLPAAGTIGAAAGLLGAPLPH
ncbi:MAG TPA: chromate transporter [Solirubrobacteraceae bacterium]|nr:chromate transporter [Solirubrobacteraceae bacterium]